MTKATERVLVQFGIGGLHLQLWGNLIFVSYPPVLLYVKFKLNFIDFYKKRLTVKKIPQT